MLELFQLLNSYNPLSAELQAFLLKSLKVKKLPANAYWLREGDVCDKIAFVEEGLLKIFHQRGDKEYITWFNKENDVIISVESFFNQSRSEDAIKTISPTTFRYIEYKDLEQAYKDFKDFNVNGRKIAQHYYSLCERHLRMVMYPARERYLLLKEKFSWMIDRIPAKYLAGYLGITPEALSKIKSLK